MMCNLLKWGITTFFLCFFVTNPSAQTKSKPNILVLAPLYIDSAFDASGNYKLTTTSIPKQYIIGLDFVHGVTAALDSLYMQDSISCVVNIVDTKQWDSLHKASFLHDTIESHWPDLVIASFTQKHEVKPVADFCLHHKIPLISATYANDGGVSVNPYLYMMNPSLFTHLDAILQHIHKQWANQKLLVFTKKGNVENLINTYIQHANTENNYNVPLQTEELTDTFSKATIEMHLDSLKTNIIWCTSLNEYFGLRLLRQLKSLSSTYKTVVIGMPTWDGNKDIEKTNFDDNLVLQLSTAFFYDKKNTSVQGLNKAYKQKYFARPSDMFFKGYETAKYFIPLTAMYGKWLENHLSDAETSKVFNPFSFKPVKHKKDKTFLYYENKHVWMVEHNEKGEVRLD